MNDGHGVFTPELVPLRGGLERRSPCAAAGDVNGDGLTDLIVPRSASLGRFSLLLRRPEPVGVLDDFNRADGELGSNWTGFRDWLHYLVHDGGGQVWFGGPLYETGRPPLGVNQEAFMTLRVVEAAGGLDNALLLKIQSGPVPANPSNAPDWIKGCIGVSYDAQNRLVYMATWRPGFEAWKNYAAAAATLADGDVLGARAWADGRVQVLRHGAPLATFMLDTADRGFFNGRGGRIGLWFEQAATAEFDDFGGGTPAPE